MTSTGDRREFDSDPLLDAGLEEILGGKTPPDLKDRILRRWEEMQRTGGPLDSLAPPTESGAEVGTHVVEAVRIVVEPTAETRLARRPRRRRMSRLVTVVASLLLLLTVAWVRFGPRTEVNLVDSVPDVTPPPPARTLDTEFPFPQREFVVPGSPDDPSAPAGTDDPSGEPSEDANAPDGDASGSSANDADLPVAPSPAAWARLESPAVIEQINQQLHAQWRQAGVTPSPAVTDEVWASRASQLILGRALRPAELNQFLVDEAATRRTHLVDRLLLGDLAADYAQQWAGHWTNWWLANAPNRGQGSRAFQVGLHRYVATALQGGVAYDDLVLSLLTAEGSNEPAQTDFNAATNFLLAFNERGAAERDVLLTSEVCRVMLGQRTQCAQCHRDERLARDQDHFWQLAAAFQPLRMEVLRPGRGRLTEDLATVRPPISYRDPTGQTRTAAPAGLDGIPFATDTSASPRSHLAHQVVQSDDFRRALVNRLWAAALEYGFTFPVDDMGRHNPASYPDLVELLSVQVAAHDFDLKQLMRWIVLSDAFDRSDVILAGNQADSPDGGAPALFSRSYYRPVLFPAPQDGLAWLARGGVPQFTSMPNDEERGAWIGLRQRDFENQRKSRDSSSVQPATAVGQLLPASQLRLVRSLTTSGKLDARAQVEHAFLVMRGRRPTEAELAEATAIYAAAADNAVTALERVFWSLANCR